MISYCIIMAVSLALNASDKKMLALTFIVAAGIFAPIPAPCFYFSCMAVEALVGVLAFVISAQASSMIVRISAMLFVFHGLGWWFDGYPDTSPYRAGVKVLEHAELLLCCLFSRPIMKRFYHV